MKDVTPILIVCAIVISMAVTTIAVNRNIKKNGGEVETIFNTPIKEIFQTK
jgi:multisubunit Na+/H+ antiporter MnhC subunit